MYLCDRVLRVLFPGRVAIQMDVLMLSMCVCLV